MGQIIQSLAGHWIELDYFKVQWANIVRLIPNKEVTWKSLGGRKRERLQEFQFYILVCVCMFAQTF